MPKYFEQATLIEYLNENVATLEDGFTTMNCVTLAILHAPTADVEEVKHGKWTRMTGRYEGLFECSKCYFTSNKSTAYCEVCGAKMDGDAE